MQLDACVCVCVSESVCVYVHASVGVHMCVVCVRVLCGEKHSCVTRFDDEYGVVVRIKSEYSLIVP